MRLEIMAILVAVVLFSSTLMISFVPAEALKSKGTPIARYGKATEHIVCGDRLCSEIPTPVKTTVDDDRKSSKMSGTHAELTHLSPQRVDQLIDALGDHDNFVLIDQSMQSHGLEDQHFRAVGFKVVEKATGMSEEVIVSPYAAADPADQIFGSVGIGESDVRGTVIKVDGDNITYTLLYVENGAVVESQFDLDDLPVADAAPSTFEHESGTMISKEAMKLFIADDYTASTYTPQEIEQMKSFAEAVSGIAVHHVSSSSMKKVSGTYADVVHLTQGRVNQLIDALEDHDNFVLIDASMNAHGLQNQHSRAVGFNVIEKATGMSEEVIVSPYAAADPADQIFGSVGIGESDVRGTVIKVDGDNITYTLLYVENGAVVESQFDLDDLPVADAAPSTFEHESGTMISKEAMKLFIADDYTASTYTPQEIEQMKSFAEAVSGIAVHHVSSSQ